MEYGRMAGVLKEQAAKVRKVELPASSMLAAPSREYDYADSYAALLPAGSDFNASDAAWEFFGRTPRWIAALMGLRNRIVLCSD
jgi:hypothetical protein